MFPDNVPQMCTIVFFRSRKICCSQQFKFIPLTTAEVYNPYLLYCRIQSLNWPLSLIIPCQSFPKDSFITFQLTLTSDWQLLVPKWMLLYALSGCGPSYENKLIVNLTQNEWFNRKWSQVLFNVSYCQILQFIIPVVALIIGMQRKHNSEK